VWSELHVDGSGILVGISDSGVEGGHPEIKGAATSNGLNWLDPWYGSPEPTDISGHGTAVTSIILGKNTGVAPGAEWMGCVNLARNLGNPAYYVECMQFLLAPYPQGGDAFTEGEPALGAQVVNYSWSCPIVEGCDPDALLPAVAALRAAGIFQAAAVGNMGTGYCGTAGDPPAIYSQAFSVGSINSDESMSDFSSVGPVLVDGSLRIKPDLLAPGEAVIAANAVNSYESVSGTSFASPHVAGVVALMWSANPGLIGEVELTESLLRQSANAYTGPTADCSNIQNYDSSGIRYGILNAYEAVRLALAAGVTP
jgi:subtilisin family serine protease